MNRADGSITNEEANKSRRLDRCCNNGFQPVEKEKLNRALGSSHILATGFNPLKKNEINKQEP